MKILLYAGTDKIGQKLKASIQPVVPDRALEICPSIDALSQRLCQPINGLVLAVILAGTREEFAKILAMGDLLEDIKTIIIIPDRKPHTIARAHTLYPRFIGYNDSDFKDVCAVVSKMLGKNYLQN